MTRRPPKVAMIVSRFPKVTNTFMLREMIALEKLGVPIELFALVHEQEGAVHEEARDLDSRAHYLALKSWEVIRAQFTWLRRNRRAYLECWRWGLVTNRQAPDFFLRTFFIVPMAAAMALRMEKLGIEHVHAHFTTYPTHAALVIKTLTGLPFSCTGHTHDVQLRRDGLRDKLSEAEFFFVCTHFIADELRELYGDEIRDKCRVVYHGIDIESFPRQPLPEDDGERPFRIVCVASFEEHKGHTFLIDAAARLRDRGVPVEIVLIGGFVALAGDVRGRIEAQVQELGLTDQVQFLGKQPMSVVREWLAWSDIGVLACCIGPFGQSDGIPNFLTECLCTGRPVVSTQMDGVKELVTDGEQGLLVRTRDAAALADAIERLRNDPELRRRMSDAARALVEAEHDVIVNTQELFDVYVEQSGRPVGR